MPDGMTSTMTDNPSPPAPLVSILIVSHGRMQLLLQCLDSCFRQDYPRREVVLVLNPGEPAAEREVRARYPEVRVLRTHRNLGFFPVLNLALANANGDFLLTVDDDAYFQSPDLVSRFVAAFTREPELACVTCNIDGPHEQPPIDRDRYVDGFKTGFAMQPREVFATWVGYYPDLFFRSAGETYLATRLWDLGLRIRQLAGPGMYHARAAEGRSDRDWAFYGLRSQVLVVFMRQPWWRVPAMLASKFARSFWHFLRDGRPGVWLHAWWSSLVHLPAALRLRKPISGQTVRLLNRLRREFVTDANTLPKPAEAVRRN